jgi:hypothetical protein
LDVVVVVEVVVVGVGPESGHLVNRFYDLSRHFLRLRIEQRSDNSTSTANTTWATTILLRSPTLRRFLGFRKQKPKTTIQKKKLHMQTFFLDCGFWFLLWPLRESFRARPLPEGPSKQKPKLLWVALFVFFVFCLMGALGKTNPMNNNNKNHNNNEKTINNTKYPNILIILKTTYNNNNNNDNNDHNDNNDDNNHYENENNSNHNDNHYNNNDSNNDEPY